MTKPNKNLKPASLSEARRMGALVGVAPFIRPRDYIGGTRQQARDKYWQTDNEMYILTDSVARRYGINPELLRGRMDAEGYTDQAIKDINAEYEDRVHPERYNRNFIAPLGEQKFNSPATPYVAGEEFGLDDVATYINDGRVKLINENWGDGQFRNEKGRWTNMAMGHNYSDNIGIMAATLKAMRDQAKKDFPNASEADLDRYAGAYYNRGFTGGKKYAKSGGKGYKVKRSLEDGGRVDVFKDGGSIHIAPSKRGTFTAAATKHGMGVQEFASRVLRNKDSYSPAMVKKANFARNASKWNH